MAPQPQVSDASVTYSRAIHLPKEFANPRFIWHRRQTATNNEQLVRNARDIIVLVCSEGENFNGPSFTSLSPMTCSHCGVLVDIFFAKDRFVGELAMNRSLRKLYQYDDEKARFWRGGILARAYTIFGGSNGVEKKVPADLDVDCPIEIFEALKEEMDERWGAIEAEAEKEAEKKRAAEEEEEDDGSGS
jgi:hypothetical protein